LWRGLQVLRFKPVGENELAVSLAAKQADTRKAVEDLPLLRQPQ
jgi:hypothetical protein